MHPLLGSSSNANKYVHDAAGRPRDCEVENDVSSLKVSHFNNEGQVPPGAAGG